MVEGEFKKYKTVEELPKLLLNLITEKTQAGLGAIKKGVGAPAILKFLNGGKEKGNWK